MCYDYLFYDLTLLSFGSNLIKWNKQIGFLLFTSLEITENVKNLNCFGITIIFYNTAYKQNKTNVLQHLFETIFSYFT